MRTIPNQIGSCVPFLEVGDEGLASGDVSGDEEDENLDLSRIDGETTGRASGQMAPGSRSRSRRNPPRLLVGHSNLDEFGDSEQGTPAPSDAGPPDAPVPIGRWNLVDSQQKPANAMNQEIISKGLRITDKLTALQKL